MCVSHLTLATPYPARRDQAHREAVLRRQRHAVHLVAEQVPRVECLFHRHAAGEALGHLQVEAAAGIGLNRSGGPTADDARVVANRYRPAIDAVEDDFGCLLPETSPPQQRREGVPEQPARVGAAVPRW